MENVFIIGVLVVAVYVLLKIVEMKYLEEEIKLNSKNKTKDDIKRLNSPPNQTHSSPNPLIGFMDDKWKKKIKSAAQIINFNKPSKKSISPFMEIKTNLENKKNIEIKIENNIKNENGNKKKNFSLISNNNFNLQSSVSPPKTKSKSVK